MQIACIYWLWQEVPDPSVTSDWLSHPPRKITASGWPMRIEQAIVHRHRPSAVPPFWPEAWPSVLQLCSHLTTIHQASSYPFLSYTALSQYQSPLLSVQQSSIRFCVSLAVGSSAGAVQGPASRFGRTSRQNNSPATVDDSEDLGAHHHPNPSYNRAHLQPIQSLTVAIEYSLHI
jgi:hypothetical protein